MFSWSLVLASTLLALAFARFDLIRQSMLQYLRNCSGHGLAKSDPQNAHFRVSPMIARISLVLSRLIAHRFNVAIRRVYLSLHANEQYRLRESTLTTASTLYVCPHCAHTRFSECKFLSFHFW